MQSASSPENQRPRIIIVGAGFAGLEAVWHLAHTPVEVTLFDRNNYHGFWPLLYQVATAGLEPQQIAQPIRAITRRIPNLSFRQAKVQSIDRYQRLVHTDQGAFSYDELIVAPGSITNFYGLQQVEQHSFDLKDIPEGLAIRNHILTCFEQAMIETDPVKLQRLLTFVIVGGGPTGVEMAGAIMELIRDVLRKDYPLLDFSKVRVILLEAADRVLLAFPVALSRKAEQALSNMGVKLQFGASVVDYEEGELRLKDGKTLPTRTVIWAAGVQGNPLGKTLDVPLQRGGRIAVTPELHLADDPSVWIIGDLAQVEGPDGRPYPQLATVAMQQGRLAARNLLRKLNGQPLERFRYVDKGIMATIGRRAAVARIWHINWSGPIAWYLWLVVHLFYLIGVRNRIVVLINWAYNFFTYDRGPRAVIAAAPPKTGSTPTRDATNSANNHTVNNL